MDDALMYTPTRSVCIALCALILSLAAQPALATIYWVGNSATCDGLANTFDNMDSAVLAALVNPQNDAIRLTNTVDYTGVDGDALLQDHNPGTTGSLVVEGGYADCGSGQSGRALIHDTSGHTFIVNTNAQPSSQVTLKHLEITGAALRAVYANGFVNVTLDDVWIHDNQRGIAARAGAYINMLSNTVIEDNGSMGNTGGGIFCTGADSYVDVKGRLTRNSAPGSSGGNIYLEDFCYVELHPGAIIEGNGGSTQAVNGGGIYVNATAELFSNGNNPQVRIQSNRADNGGGLYVNGSGHASLLNTAFLFNFADVGSAIYANDGGAPTQITMDRVSDCPNPPIHCSEIDSNLIVFSTGSVVRVSNSHVDIQRTTMQSNTAGSTGDNNINVLVSVGNNGEVRLNSINMTLNTVRYLLRVDEPGKIIMTHATIADNEGYFPGNVVMDSFLAVNFDVLDIQNSIMIDTQGIDDRAGQELGKCNMIDVPGDWVAGDPPAYFIDTPMFVDKPGGDYRQVSSSPGVDMCNQDFFVFSTEKDLGYQDRPVNDGTNPSGNPGEAGGEFDGGFWETYDNVAQDYDLTVVINGTGSGTVMSTNFPGINCPGDCSETYSQGTTVILEATPAEGSAFDWTGCDSILAGGLCQVMLNANRQVTATFTDVSDRILEDNFESGDS